MITINDTIRQIPKVEQHVHIEAAITTSLARELSKRNNIALPETIFASETSFACNDYHELHHTYDAVASVICTRQDYQDLVYDYLCRSAAEGSIYTEITLSPDHAIANNIPYDDMLDGTITAMNQAKQDTGIESRIIMIFVRHYGVKRVEHVARLVADNLHPFITGVGMAGDETSSQAKDFERAFSIAHNAGLKCTAHAGEVESADSIWQCLHYLPVERIGHGVKAINDPTLIATLIDRNISLEVCPTSNLFTKAYPSYEAHPLRQLFDAGVTLSLNSDDPTFFATSIGGEYQVAHDHFGFTEKELQQVTCNAIDTAFVDQETKTTLQQKLLA